MPDDRNENEIPTASDVDPGPGVSTSNLPVPGYTWGKYLIEKPLGAGGQADVFQAYDRFGAAGHVALKVARSPIPDKQAQTWTQAEAEPLVKLDHPNIVRVVDAGCVNGTPYVATRLVKGLPLSAHVKSNPPSVRQILDWMIQLVGAVAYAHEQGIIHRDLKPSNIIITPQGQPRIIDLGISSLIDPYQPEHKSRSSGTLFFMPPEQAGGDPQADHRIDVFALGGILKVLLTGTGPYGPFEQAKQAFERIFAGEGSSDDVRQRLRAHMTENVEFIAEDNGPPMNRALARIANRALRVDPEKRFRNAREMLRVLGGLRNRRRFLAAGAAAVLVAIVIATTAFLGDDSQPPALPTASLEVHFQRAAQKGSYQTLAADLLPLKTGDRVQIHIEFSEPLSACLLAVDPDGTVSVLYPSSGGPSEPTRQIAIPGGRDQWLKLVDPGGIETIVLLARREAITDLEMLKNQVQSLSPAPAMDRPGLLIANGSGVHFIESKAKAQRPFDEKPVTVEKGFLAALAEMQGSEWVVIRAVSFPYTSGTNRSPATRDRSQ
jgi:serine/threonine protein kinase